LAILNEFHPLNAPNAVPVESSDNVKNLVNIIQREGCYMLIASDFLSFRDFMNHTTPMALEKLCKSCGLNPDEYSKGTFPYEHYTSILQLRRARYLASYSCFDSSMTIKSSKHAKTMNALIISLHGDGEIDGADIRSIWKILNVVNILRDPVYQEIYGEMYKIKPRNAIIQNNGYGHVFIENCESIRDVFNNVRFILWNVFKKDENLGVLQCDPEDENVQKFFTTCPKLYLQCVEMWNEIEKDVTKVGGQMTMLKFLMRYNYNDVRILHASIKSFAGKYRDKYKINIHNDLSIAKCSQRLAYKFYDKDAPPIYSCPPSHAFYFRDLRKSLSGGICQVLHRAINVNGSNQGDHIPRAACVGDNGEAYKMLTVLDFNSLYPCIARQEIFTGPGLIYVPEEMGYGMDDFEIEDKRFFAEGMFRQRENVSISSIQWLEYLNWSENHHYKGRIRHAYNHIEKQFGGYSIDGYALLEDEIVDVKITKKNVIKHVAKRVILEYRGCHVHKCPHCWRKPTVGQTKYVKDPKNPKKKIRTIITEEELVKSEELRMVAIKNAILKEDDIEDCDNFPHDIEIIYHCQWMSNWRQLERAGGELKSKNYPFLFKGSKWRSSGKKLGKEGVTENEFKKCVSSGEFFGLAMVDLKSTEEVIKNNPDVPPIFCKKTLDGDSFNGYMEQICDEKEKEKLFPREENVFCYHADNYLATNAMLKYFADKGIQYTVKYFVEYFAAKPFEKFINLMRDERIQCEATNDPMGSFLAKLSANSFIGRFALDVGKFATTKLTTSAEQMYRLMADPRLKMSRDISVEGSRLDPLHEFVMDKARVVESQPLQIQIQVYQEGF
jgi:hypothetical protein